MGKLKKLAKKPKKNKNVHLRSRYVDHSLRFLEWVNSVGFEQTIIGRLFGRLDARFGLRRVSFLFLFSLALSFVIFYEFEFPYKAHVGEIAASDIQSPISFQIVDEVATGEKRNEAELGVPPVFDFDPSLYERLVTNVYKSFRTMREEVRLVKWPTNALKREERVKDFLRHKAEFEVALGHKVSDRLFEWLVEERFNVRLENVLIRALLQWSSNKLVDAPTRILDDADGTLVIRHMASGEVTKEGLLKVAEVQDYRRRSDFDLKGVKDADLLSAKDRRNILDLARSLVTPNLTYNRQITQERRAKARESVLPVQIAVKKNQTIVNAGSKIQPVHVRILNEIRNLRSDSRKDFISLFAAILFVTLVLVFFSYLKRFTTNRVRVDPKDIVAMGLVTLLVVVSTKLFLFMTDAAFMSKFGSMLPASVFLFAAPVAAGPMLVGLVIASGEVVWLFTAFLAITLGLMVDMNFSFMLVAMIGGIAAARGVFNCKKRNDIYWAGIRTGIVNALTIATLIMMQSLGEENLLQQLIWNVPAGIVGGVLASMISMIFIPLLESMFNYTTDVKLLELSSLNHPLMQEMIVKAPGTYHHSLVVGSMVEAGAKEIGANPLLAKVMAYYHDIGKMEHAQYFIENQRPGHNPHDHVSPYMSKTILIAHVKDGAEMALEHKLGKPIIDGILQHHGTTLISFFYNKALEEQDEDINHVEEDDFRYPGPKPQFREAALVMLADSIEAAARSLDEPTASRLQNIVKNIIQSKFLDGQLDECNLTLKDLSVIEKAFRRVLLGIYHQRIDYPKSAVGMPSAYEKPAFVKGTGSSKKGTHTA